MTQPPDFARAPDILEAERAIERLIYRYSYLIDEGDVAGYLALFDGEGQVEIQGALANRFGPEHPLPWETPGLAMGARRTERGLLFQGREVLSRFAAPSEGAVRMQHVVTQPLITVQSATEATAISYMRVYAQRPDQPPALEIVGRYHDRFRMTAEGWRFAARIIEI